MRTRSLRLAVTGAAMLAVTFLHDSAQAAPKGWTCSYSIAPMGLRSAIYYACYGKSLTETNLLRERNAVDLLHAIPALASHLIIPHAG